MGDGVIPLAPSANRPSTHKTWQEASVSFSDTVEVVIKGPLQQTTNAAHKLTMAVGYPLRAVPAKLHPAVRGNPESLIA